MLAKNDMIFPLSIMPHYASNSIYLAFFYDKTNKHLVRSPYSQLNRQIAIIRISNDFRCDVGNG